METASLKRLGLEVGGGGRSGTEEPAEFTHERTCDGGQTLKIKGPLKAAGRQNSEGIKGALRKVLKDGIKVPPPQPGGCV